MKKNLFMRLMVALMVLLFSLAFVGCENKKDSWDDYSGKSGQAFTAHDGSLNMADVSAALDKIKSPDDIPWFEEEVNKINDSDDLILVKVDPTSDGRKELSGWADLNENKQVDPEPVDEKLFSRIYGKKDGQDYVEDRGYGVNSHYHHNHIGEMMFYAWLFSPSYRPYYTPMYRVSTIGSNRMAYRSTSAYTSQRTRNSSYQKQAKAKNPAAYESAKKNIKPQRKVAQEKSRKSFQKRAANKPKSSGKGFMKKASKASTAKASTGRGFMSSSKSSRSNYSARSSRSSGRSGGK